MKIRGMMRMSENLKLIESEKASVLTQIENNINKLLQVNLIIQNTNFRDDRDIIYFSGYIDVLENIIDIIKTYLDNYRGDSNE
jgi:hypothetical protein